MKIYPAQIILILSLVLVSCGNDKRNSEPEVIEIVTTEEKVVYEAAPTDASFTDQKVANLFNSYIQLKTALVNTSAENAAIEGAALAVAFEEVGADEDTKAALQTIVSSKDVEEQREAFFTISSKVEKILEGSLSSGTIYKQYCPMAFGNTGAFWISESKNINNPYFGDKMLKCGRIDAEIK